MAEVNRKKMLAMKYNQRLVDGQTVGVIMNAELL